VIPAQAHSIFTACISGGPTLCERAPSRAPDAAVFIGTVESIGPTAPYAASPSPTSIVKFRVDEAFARAEAPVFYLYAAPHELVLGKQYLVHAREADGVWNEKFCTKPQRVQQATAHIEALRSWKRGIKPSISIYGRIQSSRDPLDRTPPGQPLAVHLKQGTDHRIVTANVDGTFVISEVPLGAYTVWAQPPGQTPPIGRYPLTVTKESCTAPPMLLRPTLGQIRGRLPGLPVGRLVSDFTVEGQPPFPSKIKIHFADIINRADLPKL
jgi:hypothetical protein